MNLSVSKIYRGALNIDSKNEFPSFVNRKQQSITDNPNEQQDKNAHICNNFEIMLKNIIQEHADKIWQIDIVNIDHDPITRLRVSGSNKSNNRNSFCGVPSATLQHHTVRRLAHRRRGRRLHKNKTEK